MMKRIIKFVTLFTITGIVLSFLNNFILLWQLKSNLCFPFYHGSIRPNLFEVVLFGIAPILIATIPKKLSLASRRWFLSLGILTISSVAAWTIGTYVTLLEWCISEQNRALYLGVIGGFEWDLRQDYFVVSYFVSLLTCIIVNSRKMR